MNRAKPRFLMSLLVMIALLLAACTGAEPPAPEPTEAPQVEPTDEPAPEPTDEPEPEPEPTDEPEPEPTEEPVEEATEEAASDEEVTITFVAGAVGAENDRIRDAAAEYMEMNPGVTIEVIEGPESATDRLGLYLQYFEAQSNEVDLFQIDVIWPGDLAAHLIDLTPFDKEGVISDHFPAIVENNTVNGELVGLPWFTDAGLLYYRTDLLEKYGYDGPPTTWEELEEMAQTIQDG
ncbi:MAG: extracellular solute-binding protein, partial [Ardenticatenaceae bacterium]